MATASKTRAAFPALQAVFTRLRPRRSAITLDVGAAGVRACQLRGCADGAGCTARLEDALHIERMPRTDDLLTAESPAGPAPDGRLLRRLIGQACFAGRDINLVLSPPDVEFVPIRLPEPMLTQPPERAEAALKWEVAREMRIAAEELEVRSWRLPPSRGQPANVMAVALRTALARQWCDAFAAQGLCLKRLDVSPCALVRAARQFWPPGTDELWGVLDLGLRHATLTLVAGEAPVYVRSLAVTAHDWTCRIAEAFEVNYTAAEQMKRTHGVRGEAVVAAAPGSPPGAGGGELAAVFAGVLREGLRNLATEISRCFGYVMQSYAEHSVRRLVLTGGGAALRGLPSVLETELDIPVALLTDSPADGGGVGGPLARPAGAAARLCPDVRDAVAFGGALLDLDVGGLRVAPTQVRNAEGRT
jgi:type IV pilus assembly protein PilM